jgi:hypothetical protein
MNCIERLSRQALLNGLHMLGMLYADQNRLVVAEQMYERALQGIEEAVGPNHVATCDTLNNLGALFDGQGRVSHYFVNDLAALALAMPFVRSVCYKQALRDPFGEGVCG